MTKRYQRLVCVFCFEDRISVRFKVIEIFGPEGEGEKREEPSSPAHPQDICPMSDCVDLCANLSLNKTQ